MTTLSDIAYYYQKVASLTLSSLFAGDERERELDRFGDPLAALDASVDSVVRPD